MILVFPTLPSPLSQIASLRDQISQLQDEHTQMGAECAALRNMVEERNTFITTMKTEIYRKEYKNDTERVDLHGQILQKDNVIKKLEVSTTICAKLGQSCDAVVMRSCDAMWCKSVLVTQNIWKL